jgi:hypothetical protein
MDYTKKPEKPPILPLEWKWGFASLVRVEPGEGLFHPDTGRVGKAIHPGSSQASISGFRIGSPGSTGNSVHCHKKYRLKRLFSKNTQFNWTFIVLFSGVPGASFFHPLCRVFFRRSYKETPWQPIPGSTSERAFFRGMGL